jgi:hypothetical protein
LGKKLNNWGRLNAAPGANFSKKLLLAARNYSCYFASQELGFFILSLLYIIMLYNAAVWDGRVDFPDIFNTKKLVWNK